MSVREIHSQQDFDNAIAESGRLVVIMAVAEWAGLVKAIEPQYQSLARENTNVSCYKFDNDEVNSVAATIGVRSVPFFFFYKDGSKVAELGGANPPELTRLIQSNM